MNISEEAEKRKKIAKEILKILTNEKLTVGSAITILEMVDRDLRSYGNRRELSWDRQKKVMWATNRIALRYG